jgi:putative restriction endonuclease
MWGRRCAVSGLGVTVLLRASHIKPWRAGNNFERLDAYNGLLLSPSYDAAFDAGLISFDDSGSLLISPDLNRTAVEVLGINPAAKLRTVKDEHRIYLGYHRQAVFRRCEPAH